MRGDGAETHIVDVGVRGNVEADGTVGVDRKRAGSVVVRGYVVIFEVVVPIPFDNVELIIAWRQVRQRPRVTDVCFVLIRHTGRLERTPGKVEIADGPAD